MKMMRSLKYFLPMIFFKKNYDVVFVYVNHLNRGEKGTNFFLDPFIEACKKNRLSYIMFEESDLRGAYNKFSPNPGAIPLDFITLLKIILRKLFLYKYKELEGISAKELYTEKYDKFYEREHFIAKILKFLFLRNLKFKVCINMIGNNLELFSEISDGGTICEYQHGIFFNGHLSYLPNGKPVRFRVKNDVKTLVYGKKFKDILIKYDKTGFYTNDNVIDIGIGLKRNIKTSFNNKKILFSLQLAADTNQIYNQEKQYRDIIYDVIQTNASYLSKEGYEVYFQHHPRYNSSYSPSFECEFSFCVVNSTRSTQELINKCDLHITFTSTTIFEAAIYKIPTIFISMDSFLNGQDQYFEEYDYPFKDFKVKRPSELEDILKKLENKSYYTYCSNKVFSWSKEFYNDFDEKKFIQLIEKAKDE